MSFAIVVFVFPLDAVRVLVLSKDLDNVFSDRATPHPQGSYYVFELVWRGGIYGAVDALL